MEIQNPKKVFLFVTKTEGGFVITGFIPDEVVK